MAQQLGDYLRTLREIRGYTTRQLATRAGCSKSLIASVENGERFPSLARLWEITLALEGEFGQALFLLCIDAGIPADEVKGIYLG